MAQIITLLIMIVSVLVCPYARAGSEVDQAVAKAEIMVLKDDLKKAERILDDSKAEARDGNLKVVEELKEKLKKATELAPRGSMSDPLLGARQLLLKKKRVDDLKAKKPSDISKTSKGVKEGPETDDNKIKSTKEELDVAETEMTKAAIEVTEQEKLQEQADKRFAGFNFGVAIGVVGKAGKRDVIESAALDPNGIVRVENDGNTTANLILESHYFFTPDKPFMESIFNADPKSWGHGPFVAIQPGTQNIIEAIGAGWMLGFKRSTILAKDLARDRGDSFNIGLGVMINPNAQVLGDGIRKNEVLPAGETAVRLKTTTELGWLFVFSYTF